MFCDRTFSVTPNFADEETSCGFPTRPRRATPVPFKYSIAEPATHRGDTIPLAFQSVYEGKQPFRVRVIRTRPFRSSLLFAGQFYRLSTIPPSIRRDVREKKSPGETCTRL